MRLPRIAPYAPIVAAGLALGLLALAPLGWRLGWGRYAFCQYWLMPDSGIIAVGAVATALARLVSRRAKLGPRTLAMLLVALAAGGSLVYVPLHYIYARRALPQINDIATDIKDRPAFEVALAART